MRNKLIELLGQKCYCFCDLCKDDETADKHIEETADHLIANGVTLQQWIPVSERLPDELPESHPAWSDEVMPSKDVFVKRKGIRSLVVAWYSFAYESWMDSNELFEFNDVEYWQELPEPPKEEV